MSITSRELEVLNELKVRLSEYPNLISKAAFPLSEGRIEVGREIEKELNTWAVQYRSSLPESIEFEISGLLNRFANWRTSQGTSDTPESLINDDHKSVSGILKEIEKYEIELRSAEKNTNKTTKSFWRDWSDGKRWGMGIIAAVILMGITGGANWFYSYWGKTGSSVVITFLSARPIETSVGDTETSIREIDSTLQEEVLRNVAVKCFQAVPAKKLYGKMSFLIYEGSGGFANNFSMSETNIDKDKQTCVQDIFRGTIFPEPVGDSENTNSQYWITAKINVDS